VALKYGFFNSVNGDRTYNADDMCKPYYRIVSNGVFADDNGTTGFKVEVHSGLQIKVNAGNGIFDNKWCEMNAGELMTVPTPNVTYDRIDCVVLRVDTNARTMELKYIQGTPASSPQKPTILKTETIKDYRLANITVKSNTATITNSNIEDTRYGSECGIVSNLLQNSDISSIYAQWQSAFEEWFNRKQSEFETWLATKKNEYDTWFAQQEQSLGDITPLRQFVKNIFVGENDDKMTIPINMNVFNMESDILNVYINGMLLIKGIDYAINGYENVILTKAVDVGTQITFVVLKTNGGNTDPDYIEELWNNIEGENE
jgi:hypothetical protein